MSFEIALRHRVGEHVIEADFVSDERLTALVGRSGAGKTTILNCIAGLIRPDSGRIAVDGRLLFDRTEGVDVPVHHRQAGYLFQDARLFPHLRVDANLAYGEKLAVPAERWIGRGEVVDLLGIAHLQNRWPATLSGGEVRRVAIARALLGGARFLLLDEPLTSLDPARVEDLIQLIERIRDHTQIPILLVAHERAQIDRLAGSIVTIG